MLKLFHILLAVLAFLTLFGSTFFVLDEIRARQFSELIVGIVRFASVCGLDNCVFTAALFTGSHRSFKVWEIGLWMALGHFVMAAGGNVVAIHGFTVAEQGIAYGLVMYVGIMIFMSPLLRHAYLEYRGACNGHADVSHLGRGRSFLVWLALIATTFRLSVDGFLIGLGVGGQFAHFHTAFEEQLFARGDLQLSLWVSGWVALVIGGSVILTSLVVRAMHDRSTTATGILPAVVLAVIGHFLLGLGWRAASTLTLVATLGTWLLHAGIVVLALLTLWLVLSLFTRTITKPLNALVLRHPQLGSVLWLIRSPSQALTYVGTLVPYVIAVLGLLLTSLLCWQLFVHELGWDFHLTEKFLFWFSIAIVSVFTTISVLLRDPPVHHHH